jgi:phage tail sheath protein FI
MAGWLSKGATAAPVLVSSWSDFVKNFGGLNDSYPTTWAAYNFFANGGRQLYVKRVVGASNASGTVIVNDGVSGTTTLTATVTAASSQSTNATVTAASAAGGTVTYTATNTFVPGQTVSITGLSTPAFNLTSVVIASANGTQFTVTNAATGTAVTGATATATAVSNTITYTANNSFTAGQSVSITGLSTSAFNLSSATIATRSATQFTVTSAVTGTAVTGATATATVTVTVTANPVFTVTAINPGAWSTSYGVQVVPAGVSTRFGLNIYNIVGNTSTLVESWTDLSMDTTDKYYFRTVLNSLSTFVTVGTTGLDTTKFPYTLSSTPTLFQNGADGSAPARTSYYDATGGTATGAWTTFDPIANPLVMYNPDAAYAATGQLTNQLHGDAMIYASTRDDAFVIVDTPSGLPATGAGSAQESVTATHAVAAGATTGNIAAAYYPWINIPDGNKIPGATRLQAPGAAMVGQYLATDASRGVFKTPAGLGNQIALAVSTEKQFTNAELDAINTSTDPINAIRQVPGAGIVVMGGRTMDNTSTNRYINIRRSLIFIEKQIKDLTSFAVFENNDSRLWLQIRTTINTFLLNYWSQGGLRGTSPTEAYYVKCDDTTTSFADLQAGRVNVEVGVALEYPTEFVVIKLGQLTGNASA